MAYSSKVIEHYERPRNVGSFGTQKEIKERKDVGVGLVGAHQTLVGAERAGNCPQQGRGG
mgnify:CR=1 FL=1